MPERLHLPSRVSLVRRRKAHDGRPSEHGAHEEHASSRSGIVDSAVYSDGKRQCTPPTLTDCFAALRDQPEGMAWIGLYRPDERELNSLADEFGLHELAVEDAIQAHQ